MKEFLIVYGLWWLYLSGFILLWLGCNMIAKYIMKEKER